MRGQQGTTTKSVRGQSEVLGAVLLLSVVVMGSITVTVVGLPTVQEAQRAAVDQQVGHAMSELAADGNAAAVGEGSRSVSLPHSGDGQYAVEPDRGWIRLTRVDPADASNNEEIYNESIGAIVYRQSGGGTVAYQGGGVWRYEDGGSVMMSPPQFHYRGATLTLPVVSMAGEGTVSGRATVDLTTVDSRPVFPNESATFDDGVSYANPLGTTHVTVSVHSRYYEAWGAFFESHTDGDVSVDHANQIATLNLSSTGTFGPFSMPAEGEPIDVHRMPETGPTQFDITIVPDDTDSAEFNNLQWSLAATDGGEEFELHLKKGTTDDDPSTGCKEQSVRATVYYRPSASADYHGWYSDDAFRTSCYDADGDGDEDETRLVANFTGTATVSMKDLSDNALQQHNPSGSRNTSVTLDGTTYSDAGDDDAAIREPVGEYLGRMGPNVDLVVVDKSSNTITESQSYGVIEYDPVGTIRYLHVREHRMDAHIEGGGGGDDD